MLEVDGDGALMAPGDRLRLDPARNRRAAAERRHRRGRAARPVEHGRDLGLAARIGDYVGRVRIVAVKPAHVVRIGLAVGVRRAVVGCRRADGGERRGRGEARGCKLDFLEARRRDLFARQ